MVRPSVRSRHMGTTLDDVPRPCTGGVHRTSLLYKHTGFGVCGLAARFTNKYQALGVYEADYQALGRVLCHVGFYTWGGWTLRGEVGTPRGGSMGKLGVNWSTSPCSLLISTKLLCLTDWSTNLFTKPLRLGSTNWSTKLFLCFSHFLCRWGHGPTTLQCSLRMGIPTPPSAVSKFEHQHPGAQFTNRSTNTLEHSFRIGVPTRA